jgi:hypothetical protein
MRSSLSRPRSTPRSAVESAKIRDLPNSYGNIAVRGAGRAAVVAWLEARQTEAWVGPEIGGWTAFSDAAADSFDLARASETMIALTGDLGSAAIVAAVYNADVLGILAVERGRHVASYISYPGVFDQGPPAEDRKPEISGAPGMLAALGSTREEAELRRVLAVGTAEQFVYPLDLHAAFVRTFGLPDYTLSFSYAGAEAGEFPGDAAAFLRVG